MPDWAGQYVNYTTVSTGTSTDSSFYVTVPFGVPNIEQAWVKYLQERERQDLIMEQMIREEAELEEDKRKYPLFFLKEGIV